VCVLCVCVCVCVRVRVYVCACVRVYVCVCVHTAVDGCRVDAGIKNLEFAIADGLVTQRPFTCAPLYCQITYICRFQNIFQNIWISDCARLTAALRACPTVAVQDVYVAVLQC